MTRRMNVTDEARAKAEARFHLAERRKTDAEQAMSGVRLAKEAETKKTAHLRGLRLAKEDLDRQAAEVAKAEKAEKLAAAPKRKKKSEVVARVKADAKIS